MDAFTVVADPARRRILDELREGEVPVGELVNRLSLSQPAVSKHLRVLRDAGMVGVRVDAQLRHYSIAPDALADIERWVGSFQGMWRHRLDALETHLDVNATKRRQQNGRRSDLA